MKYIQAIVAIVFLYLLMRIYRIIKLHLKFKDIPDVKWPFINIKDENNKNLNLLCIRGYLEHKKDKDFFEDSLEYGIKYIGCSSALSFPGKCTNKHGSWCDTYGYKGKSYEDYVMGWCHCFRDPDKYIKRETPKVLISESDFCDNIKHEPDNTPVEYDFICYCPKDKECDSGWHHHNKNWPLAKKAIECMCNQFNLSGILVGRKDCELNVMDNTKLKKVDFLPYWDFIKEIRKSRFIFIPSYEDPSPRVITESMILNKPILVNRDILGGWKYVNEKSGGFISEDSLFSDISTFILSIPSYNPRNEFFKNYGIENSGKELRSFLKGIYPELSECNYAKFPVS